MYRATVTDKITGTTTEVTRPTRFAAITSAYARVSDADKQAILTAASEGLFSFLATPRVLIFVTAV